LISHFAARDLIGVPEAITGFLDGGRTAVALFFVLSGFILTYNYSALAGKSDRRRFYINRIARIYPVVLLALSIGAIGVVVAVLNPERGFLGSWYALGSFDPVALAVSFASQITVTTGWLPAARLNQPWNGPAWSIACEMFFYLLFPALIAWVRLRGMKTIAIGLATAFVIQILLIVAIRAFAPDGQRGFLVSQFPLTHLFDFLIGVGAGIAFLRGAGTWLKIGNRRNLAVLASTVPLILLSIFQPVDPAYLLMTPFFALLIVALAVPPRNRKSWLSHSLLLLLGEASFALYLIHVPLLNLFSISAPPLWAGWFLLAATVAISVLIFKVFETPTRLLTKRVLLRYFSVDTEKSSVPPPAR
jgi:peptidoglycan/LPS O-acetylase OafA/YrhL